MVDKRYKTSFDTVIHALQAGSYDSLPQRAGSSEVPSCYIQDPIKAVAAIAQAKGISMDAFSDQASQTGEFRDTVAALIDDWRGLINETSIYKHLREAAYLPPGKDSESTGHPQDGSNETTTSFGNIAFMYPDEVADHVHYDMAAEEQAAYDAIVAWDAQQLQKLYASDPKIVAWVQARYDAYTKARKS